MAVLAYRGDLRRLSCDAWYLPGDFRPYLNPIWTQDDPGLAAALGHAAQRLPDGWGERGVRVLPIPLEDRRRAVPVLAAIPNGGTNDWSYHRETLRQFVDAAVAIHDRPAHLADRSRRLLAVPLIGTGLSTWQPDTAQHMTGLLDALHEESDRAHVDLVVVVKGDADRHWSAVQALRRRRLLATGVEAELADLVGEAERLASLAREGRLVLFTGAGTGLPAGLPDWRGLLRQLAHWAGYDDRTVDRLVTMDLLDQAALIAARADGDLADEVASRLDAPHHSLAHGMLANLPVRENVTLNYDHLFEDAARLAGAPVSVLPYEPAGERWLLKLHGDISPERRRDIVLTREDYLGLGQHRATLTGLVQALLVTRHMLFVGFGMSDPHLHGVVHDVKRALAGARGDLLGTALLLHEDELQKELWKGELHHLTMGTGDVPPLARRLELFLDHLLLLSTTSDAHLFDPSFAALLTPEERSLRDALRAGVDGLDLAASPAGRRVQDLLTDLGSPTG